jgi:hypothetical protein
MESKFTHLVVHCKKDKHDVYIGRPSKWGNPFSHKEGTLARYKVKTQEEAALSYRNWILNGDGRYLLKFLPELRGKVLGCWCSPNPCHGHILALLANDETMTKDVPVKIFGS